MVRCGPMSSEAVRCRPRRSDVVRCGPMSSEAVQCRPRRSDVVRCGPVRSEAVRCGPMRQLVIPVSFQFHAIDSSVSCIFNFKLLRYLLDT